MMTAAIVAIAVAVTMGAVTVVTVINAVEGAAVEQNILYDNIIDPGNLMVEREGKSMIFSR